MGVLNGRRARTVAIVGAVVVVFAAGTVTGLVLGGGPDAGPGSGVAAGPTAGAPVGPPSASAKPAASPPVPTPARPTAAPGTRTSASARRAGRPGELIDLRRWKLTLPVAASGSDEAAEIVQPRLATYAVSPFFTVNAAGDGVVFQADAGGATTGGSGYPRSELREMTADGSDEAAWSPSSGTHTMTVTAAVTHLTTAKPQVTVAQVHDDSDDVLVVRLDGPHRLYAEHDGDNFGDLDAHYTLGRRFTVRMVAAGGRIRIFYNGVRKADVAASGSGHYFKAGCYTQSNTDKGDAADAYAQVVIYSLTVAHAG